MLTKKKYIYNVINNSGTWTTHEDKKKKMNTIKLGAIYGLRYMQI